MTPQLDNPKRRRRWQFRLRTLGWAVTAVAVCVWVAVNLQNQATNVYLISDSAVEAYQEDSFSDAFVKCDRYLARYPNGDEADAMRELRMLAEAALLASAANEPMQTKREARQVENDSK